ncbi:MAG: tetratricopeptide repeat protein [Leptolyngbyaceae cyanobacterium SM1_4_3]|nr:tetratricopeptide repeat protein [Leptolyngbyaceae cyanobacterium SM1_4_3]
MANRGIEALNTLLTIDPNDNQARAQRALLYSYQGRFAEAIADYEIVLQSNPTPDAVLGAAQVYTYTGDYRRGLELFNRYRASGQAISGNAAIAYALALQETGSPAEAIQVLEPQLRRSPQINRDTIQLRAALASAYAANRQFAEAEAAIDPLRGRGDSRLTLARALSVMGRYSGDTAYYTEAASLYRQVLATTSATPALVREAADVLSGVSSEQAYALQLYQQLTPQFPNDKGLLTQQLVLQSQLGQISRADLRQRLQAELQPLPGDRFQQQVIARSLLRIDSPDPELLPIYQSLLSAGINEPLLNFRVAQILIQRNDYAGARTALNAYSAAVGPADQSPNLLLAEIDRREGNLDSAAQRYESIIASNPADEGVLNGALQGLAGIRQAQGRVNEAIAFYDQLIARDPQNLTRQLGRASLAYQARLISEAEAQAVLSRWLQERPATDTPPELYNLVSVLPANAQRESLYLTLLEADPNNIPIQLRLVQVLAQRDPALARARVAELVARDPQNLSAYFVQGELAQQLGDLDLASESYETILSQEPNNTDALSALGGIRFQQRQYDSAAQLYNQVLSIRPDDPVAQTSLIALTAVQGRRLEALQRLEQIQVQQLAQGITDENLNQQMQLLEEGFLQQRGFSTSFTYDGKNRMLSATVGNQSLTIQYDYRNRQVKRVEDGVATFFLYDGWSLIGEYNAAGQLKEKYIHGPVIDELLSKTNSNGTVYYHQDGLGSTVALTNASGSLVERYSYDVFGAPSVFDATSQPINTSTVGNRFLFTGREWLGSFGLYDYRNRVYSPDLGRFLQTDPIRFNAGDVNLYRYVSNKPVSYIDPEGKVTGVLGVVGAGALLLATAAVLTTPQGQQAVTGLATAIWNTIDDAFDDDYYNDDSNFGAKEKMPAGDNTAQNDRARAAGAAAGLQEGTAAWDEYHDRAEDDMSYDELKDLAEEVKEEFDTKDEPCD